MVNGEIITNLLCYKTNIDHSKIGYVKMSHQNVPNSDFTTEMLPLDQRFIPYNRNGVKDNVSGLNKLWADLKYEWIPYRVPPKIEDLSVAGASETWCERSCMIINDLDFLLSLPHHKVTLVLII